MTPVDVALIANPWISPAHRVILTPCIPNPAGDIHPMTDQKPLGPFTLTPARITLLALGVLAIVLITGAILGGVANYAMLKQTAGASSEPASSSQPLS